MNTAILERPADRPDRASYYLDRARELRAMAEAMATPDARLLLMTTAAEYERLAAALKKSEKRQA